MLPEGNSLKRKHPKGIYNISYISPLAITLTDKIQIITRFYGSPKEIHSNYDFVHCTAYWTSWDNRLVIPHQVKDAVKAKHLVYIGSKYPVASAIRTKKFLKKGWNINAGQFLKIAMQISELNLHNEEELREQLVGMYSENLNEILDKTIKEDGVIDTESLVKEIDNFYDKGAKKHG